MASDDSYCAFTKVPVELLLRISAFLTTPELGNLRLTCKDVETKLFHSFATEFFYRKQFMLSLFSLEALVGISKSRLSPFLQRPQFGLESPQNIDLWSFRRQDDTSVSLRCLDELDNEKHGWVMGTHCELLTEAFRNLKELRDVVVRGFNSRGRHRDGVNAQWKSYGWNSMTRMAGSEVLFNTNTHVPVIFGRTFNELAFSVIIAALGKSGARPQAIELLMGRHNGIKMRDDAFMIPRNHEASIVPMLQSLEKLHVDMTIITKSSDNFTQVRARRLAGFLGNTSSLKNFRLNGDDRPCEFFEWLAKPVGSDVNDPPRSLLDLPAITLPKLEELSLGQWTVRPKDLLASIEKFAPTLRSLEMWRITFDREPYDDKDLEAEYIAEAKTVWTNFFERLVEIEGLELDHLKVSLMSQTQVTRGAGRVYGKQYHVCFKGEGEEAKTRSITGSTWKSFVLRDMLPVRAVYPDGQAPDPMDISEAGDDDDEYEDSDVGDDDE